MDDLYEDLENYDDVDKVNQLKAENSELKHKLEECTKSMEKLQKGILQDFDKLEAEFKAMENNYSSLLQVARTEIQRKTAMITNLNIEKDMLIITAAQKVPPNHIQKLVRNVKNMATRKKKNPKNMNSPKEKNEFIRSEFERQSSETSSTATDNCNRIVGNERVIDDTRISISKENTQEKELHKREDFSNYKGDSDRSPGTTAVDRRLCALARHQFSKLSSDEEFEDLYSALKPKTVIRDTERNRKRGRDDPQDAKTFYPNSHERPSRYSGSIRDRLGKKNTSRFSSNDRNRSRDNQYNDNDRNINRGKQYVDSSRNMSDKYDPHYQRYSPERHRRDGKDHIMDHHMKDHVDRYTLQYDRSRRLESPPRERNVHRIRERRKSFHGRERDDHKLDVRGYNYSETHTVRNNIHGEYKEPLKKRPRIDPPYTIHQEDRRVSEKLYSKEMYPSNLKDHTCQSPDFSHTEESSNEPIPEIRSTASTVLEDPRVTSNKYILSTEGNKDMLKSVNANNIDLQLVDKSLWNLQEVPVPDALRIKPSEISEELVDEMDVDKPLSIVSLESGEICSETTDTAIEDISESQEINKLNHKHVSYKNYNRKSEKENHEVKSPIVHTSKDNIYNGDVLEKEVEAAKPEKTKKRKVDETLTTSSRNKNKDVTHTHCENSEKPSILQRLIESACDKRPNHDNPVKVSKRKKLKERKQNSELKTSDKTEQEISKMVVQKDLKDFSDPEKETETNVEIFREFEHRVYSTRHIVEGDLELSDDSNEEAQLKIDEKADVIKKHKTRRNSRDTCKEKIVNVEDTTRKTRSKKDKNKDDKTSNKFTELFGESSNFSLITPEDLNIDTSSTLPAECCPPAPEDAQDGIIETEKTVETQKSEAPNGDPETKVNLDGSTVEENKQKINATKDSKDRTYKSRKNSETVPHLDDTHKPPDEQELTDVKKHVVFSTATGSVSEVKLVLSNEKLKQLQKAKTSDTSKLDAIKLNDKSKATVKSNKRLKKEEEKRLLVGEPEEVSNGQKTSSVLDDKTLTMSDNKENASGNDNSEGTIGSTSWSISENALISNVSTVNNEKPHLFNTEKDTSCSIVAPNVPNLAPLLDEPGLVKTVVISTGIQQLESNSSQYATPYHALASLTPAKELSSVNASESEPKITHSAHVSVTIERDDSVCQPENDVPDVRIIYKRRRKVKK